MARRDQFNVQVEGLSEFIKELGVLPKHWRAAERVFLAVAATYVAERAVRNAHKYEADNGVYALAASGVTVSGPGVVKYGGMPYSMGAEFGSYHYRQFETWRGSGDDAGYFFWPAIREFRDNDMLDEWIRHVWRVVAPAFPSY